MTVSIRYQPLERRTFDRPELDHAKRLPPDLGYAA